MHLFHRRIVKLVTVCTIVGATASLAAHRMPPSILVVSLDTFRADHLGTARYLTPNLDDFAAESVQFTNASAQANITSMSHGSLFTGRYPSELGIPGPQFVLDTNTPTLAEVIGYYGYTTVAVTGGGHLDQNFGIMRGFKELHVPAQMGSLFHTLPVALAWLDARPADSPPFFLFLHTYDTHAPYLEPAPFGHAYDTQQPTPLAELVLHTPDGTEHVFGDTYLPGEENRGLLARRKTPRAWDASALDHVHTLAQNTPGAATFTDDDAAEIRDAYAAAVAYTDAWFGRLVLELKERGIYDQTIIIVLADHGESLGEQGLWGHGETLSQAELHVPLLIRFPGATPRVVDRPVELLDVMPTVLEMAGATLPASMRGRSLVPWLQGAAGPTSPLQRAEGNRRMISVADNGHRLVFSGSSASNPWLVSLLQRAAPEGPAWSGTPMSASERAELQARMEAWRRSVPVVSPSTEGPTEAALQAMQRHGYWSR